jgi:NAD(P)H-hydrate repair Nnr-like enzyme with NAD(P)H-hydrate dehydratase domain
MLQRFHPSLLRNFSFVSSLLWTTTAPRSIAAAFGSNNNSCKNMSNTADEMLDACILPLTSRSHKGSSGRVGILGGNERYTGAPYYAGYSALKVGADLSYVFCAEEAAQPIKSYSPELMVAPVYSAKQFSSLDKDDPHAE